MRRVLTILAPVVALTTLVVFSVLYLQYRVRIRGHSLGLPHPNLAPRPSNILGVNIHLFSDSSETINNTFDIISDAGFGWVRGPPAGQIPAPRPAHHRADGAKKY